MKATKQFKPTDRFLALNVYQFPLGNTGGITDMLTTESIYIPCQDGPTEFKDIIFPDRIFIPEQRGENYFALIPVIQPEGLIGPMAGGNLATSSDSRCNHIYHIHDRFETQQHYNSNFI